MSEANEGAPQGVTEDTTAADQVAEQTRAQGDEQTGDDAAAATDEGQAQPKPKKSVQERIDELTAARREAERDRDFYREQALRFQQQQPAQEAQQHQPKGDDEPDPADYEHGENDLRYVRDTARWEARQEFRAQAERERQQQQARTARQNFETRKAALFPQGEPEGLQNFLRIPELPSAVIEIVAESDIGPKIADHLGANPAELRRLEGMSPIQQARELTRIELRLSEPARPSPKTATDAPEPPPQARGAGGRFAVAPDTDDFAAFDKSFG